MSRVEGSPSFCVCCMCHKCHALAIRCGCMQILPSIRLLLYNCCHIQAALTRTALTCCSLGWCARWRPASYPRVVRLCWSLAHCILAMAGLQEPPPTRHRCEHSSQGRIALQCTMCVWWGGIGCYVEGAVFILPPTPFIPAIAHAACLLLFVFHMRRSSNGCHALSRC